MSFIKKFKPIIACILIIALIAFVGYKINKKMNKEITPVIMTQEEVEDPEKIQQMVNENSDVNISKYQAKEITNTITQIVEEEVQPTTVVQTTGENYQQKSKEYAEQHKADAVIITPTKGETKTVEEIKPTDVVNLNQYNIKAYPENLISIGAYGDGDVCFDYEHKIKVFGAHAYIGPSVKYNTKDKDATVGVKLTIPF
jgi:hypothetical protein